MHEILRSLDAEAKYFCLDSNNRPAVIYGDFHDWYNHRVLHRNWVIKETKDVGSYQKLKTYFVGWQLIFKSGRIQNRFFETVGIEKKTLNNVILKEYDTFEEAIKGHDEMIANCKNS